MLCFPSASKENAGYSSHAQGKLLGVMTGATVSRHSKVLLQQTSTHVTHTDNIDTHTYTHMGCLLQTQTELHQPMA